MNRLVLIDTANFLHRAFYAFPMNLTASDGQVINAVYGFSSMLINLVKELEPTHLACAMESEEEVVFREVEFPEYKATRVPKSPEEQVAYESQFPLVLELLAAADIKTLTAEGYEADDVIGTVAKQVTSSKSQIARRTEVIITSNDRDLMQLIDGRVKFYLPAVGKNKAKLYRRREFLEEYGFAPENLVDFKALRGDTSDNIPGVRGIGEKTATELIRKHGNLEKIYKNILEIRPAVATKLNDGKDKAELSKRLATIATEAPLRFKLSDLKFGGFVNDKVVQLFEKWNFKSLLAKINNSPETKVESEDQLKLL
ncbi:hypothetical protein GTO10_01660 [Candidatus Saccharibacteria bacterium]|nr:hypothetical protein [Candidatus Saccharibacteria bacterium]